MRLSKTFPTQSMGLCRGSHPNALLSPLKFGFFSVLVTLKMMSSKAAQDSLPLFISAENKPLM